MTHTKLGTGFCSCTESSKTQEGVHQTCQRWQHAPLLCARTYADVSQRENTHTTHTQIHTSNQKLNTKPYFVYLFHSQPKSKTVNHQPVKKDCMHVCQISWNTKERADSNRRSSKQLSSTATTWNTNYTAARNSKINHGATSRDAVVTTCSTAFSASQVGADSQFGASTANRLLGGPGEKGVRYTWVSGET